MANVNVEAKININPLATHGFDPATPYDTHRPSYPTHAVSSLLRVLHLAAAAVSPHQTTPTPTPAHKKRIVELGAGTGKFTSALAARGEGFEIVAGEPHARMRGVLEGKGLKGVRVLSGRAEEMEGVGDGWAGGVVVAQAFHWFATVETLQEVKRMLAPGGGLGMIWNVDDFNATIEHTPSTPYEARLKALIRSLPNAVSYRDATWQNVFVPEQQQLFEWPLKEDEVAYETSLSREQIWDRFATMSQVSRLEGAELEAMKRSVFEALTGDDVEEDEDGVIRWHGRTVWYWTFPVSDS